jgi:hypothetical protein
MELTVAVEIDDGKVDVDDDVGDDIVERDEEEKRLTEY